ncbi:MAG: hypothetical protein KAR30_00350 [Gammaproteobacteria bacterium]|nr:hypothetical protein [Gammaproteobacteria bacterium]
MVIRSTTDPISGREVDDPEHHPCFHEYNGDNELKVYFENEENLEAYLHMYLEGNIVLNGDDSDDYVAEG